MDIRKINNKKEYKAALDEIEQLWSAPANSPEADRLDVLTLLVEHYEKKHFPMTDPELVPTLQAPNAQSMKAMAEAQDIIASRQARFESADALIHDLEKNNSKSANWTN
jgi:antitoxin component HigA of HigAB toxin-antitoxin module